MSFSTDMLTKAQTAYEGALSGRMMQHNGRRFEQHDIDKLRAEVVYWQGQVNAETARANGQSSRQPIRFML
jgi:hypothetical protein